LREHPDREQEMPMPCAFPARSHRVDEAVAPDAAHDLVAYRASLARIGARFRLSFPREHRYNYVAATRRLRDPQLCNQTDETGGRSAMSGLLSSRRMRIAPTTSVAIQ
jgi:hypothetical protein